MRNLKTAPAAKSSKTGAGKKSIGPRPVRSVQSAKVEDDSRRNELIAKSAKLFREKGYDKTTVRDIAAAVGIQAGSWFYHFKTKQDILLAVMEQGMARSLESIEAIVAQSLPPRETFRQLVRTHLQTLLAPNNHFIPVLLYESRSLDKAARAKIVALTDRYEAIWDEVIDALHRSGDWTLPTRLDRLLLFGALNWSAQWYRAGAGISIEELADQAIVFILRSAPKSRKRA
ncbi:MAG TPA: TetR/AcrR family transcriptional regulator [Burkholderiaceae bacterium]|jgi:AcrR family transcriptional regulator|nr:TetR/AcrR family transcriptional regulator [Burkholderiaceae bacterium]